MTTILIISPEPWKGHFVSKHHYAVQLAQRGYTVLFFGPPDSGGQIWIETLEGFDNNLHILHSPKVAIGLRLMPSPIRSYLESMWLIKIEKLIGKNINIVWNFENSRFFDFKFAGEKLKIYHQVDLDQIFHPGVAARTADIVIALNIPIFNELSKFVTDSKIHIVSHGVYLSELNESSYKKISQRSPSINASYVGNLGMTHIDVSAFVETVRKYSDLVTFNFFGHFDDTMPLRKELSNSENVVWWGWQEPNIVAENLKVMDVNIVLYKSRDNVDQLANSHKILEYLNGGGVVVASYLKDYADKQDIIEMIDIDGDYPAFFASIIKNLDFYNSEEKKRLRRDFAMQHSYEKKLDEIFKIINSNSPNFNLD